MKNLENDEKTIYDTYLILVFSIRQIYIYNKLTKPTLAKTTKLYQRAFDS